MKVAERVKRLPSYAFAELGQRLKALAATGTDIIRLDIGSPDLPPHPMVIEALTKSARRDDTHGYPGYYGTPALRSAIAGYYRRRFDVDLNPETEVLPLIGSKEGIHHVATTFVDPGSPVLVPDPGYPTYNSTVVLSGGIPYPLPLLKRNNYLPDLGAIPEEILQAASVLWLNYPNNPTAAVAGLDFLTEVVELARRYDILIVYDNPYCEIAWGGIRPPSILQVPGAKEIAVEFNSLSKMANMAGWRIGMVVGNAEAVAALARVKTNIDSGLFIAIQEAAVAALNLPDTWIEELTGIYQLRWQIVVRALDRMGLAFTPSSATLYVWVDLPPGTLSQDFATELLNETYVSVAPGITFGAHGEGHVRISMVQPESRIEEAMERWERWLIGKSVAMPSDRMR